MLPVSSGRERGDAAHCAAAVHVGCITSSGQIVQPGCGDALLSRRGHQRKGCAVQKEGVEGSPGSWHRRGARSLRHALGVTRRAGGHTRSSAARAASQRPGGSLTGADRASLLTTAVRRSARHAAGCRAAWRTRGGQLPPRRTVTHTAAHERARRLARRGRCHDGGARWGEMGRCAVAAAAVSARAAPWVRRARAVQLCRAPGGAGGRVACAVRLFALAAIAALRVSTAARCAHL